MTARLFIGTGSGFAGDRADAAGAVIETLARRQVPSFLIYETLAERTLALAQQAGGERAAIAVRFLESSLHACLEHGIRIIGNFGGRDPLSVAERVAEAAPPQRVRVLAYDNLAGLDDPELVGDLAEVAEDLAMLQVE